MVEKLNEALANALPGFVSGLEVNEQTRRVFGFIVSSAFVDLDHDARQRLLRQVIEASLLPDETRRIGPIVTMTPAEAAIDEPTT